MADKCEGTEFVSDARHGVQLKCPESNAIGVTTRSPRHARCTFDDERFDEQWRKHKKEEDVDWTAFEKDQDHPNQNDMYYQDKKSCIENTGGYNGEEYHSVMTTFVKKDWLSKKLRKDPNNINKYEQLNTKHTDWCKTKGEEWDSEKGCCTRNGECVNRNNNNSCPVSPRTLDYEGTCGIRTIEL